MNEFIHIINRTSSGSLDDLIQEAVAPFQIPNGPRFEVVHIDAAPPAGESQRDVDRVASLIPDVIRRLDGASGYMIACFSDPGLHAAREATPDPVYGIAECGLLTAMTLGHKIGVISILLNSIGRHWRMFGAMGICSRIGADLPVGLGVLELETNPAAFGRLVGVGVRLRDEFACEAVVLGCAGMARYQDRLAAELGIHVVEPVRAAAAFAVGRSFQRRAAAALIED